MVNYPMPPAWMEKCYLTITQWANTGGTGTSISMQGIIDRTSLSIDIGEKPVDAIALLNQGYVYSYKPEAMTEISFDYYTKLSAIQTTSSSAGGTSNSLDQFFMGVPGPGGSPSLDNAEPVTISNSTNRNKVRVAILWSTDPSLTDAISQPASLYPGRRLMLADAFITSHTMKFDDILKVSVTIKLAPFDSDASTNIKVDTTDGTTQIPAVSDYVGTSKW